MLDSWLGDTRTGTRSDISVTSFARTHALTAGGNGGLVGVDDEEQLDRCLSLRRWGRRSESYLFGSRKGSTSGSARSPTARPTTWSSCSTRSATTSSPRSWAPPTASCSCGSSTAFNGQRQANWQRLQDFLATREGLTPGRTTAGARTTWMRFCSPSTRTRRSPGRRCRSSSSSRASRPGWSGRGTSSASRASPRSNTGRRRRDWPNCDRVMDRSVSLPIHHGLDADHMGFICEQLDALYQRYA